MIGFLRGKIISKQPPELLLDVQGVGYDITCPMTTFYTLPTEGTEISILTHFVVREDAQLLYGFKDKRDRELFRTLIKISGVGPKLAITILSGITADEFVACIQRDDAGRLQSIPGIGGKTAKRLIVETRDKLKDWQIQDQTLQAEQQILSDPENSASQDAIAAMISLGYKPADAKKAVSRVYEPGQSSEVIIRMALKEMA